MKTAGNTGFLFFTDMVIDNRARLDPVEMRHAVTVLRYRAGDPLELTDGCGNLYHGRISDIGRREAWVEIEGTMKQERPAYAVHVAIAPTKQFERMGWCIEKLTELGVRSITPLICVRSERQKWNGDRARKVMISALKQSRQVFLPDCNRPKAFSEVIREIAPDRMRYLAIQGPESVPAYGHYPPGSDVMICIGPEGDFSGEEYQQACDAGFVPLSLGSNRLRTETAAVVAVATIHALNLS
jgi:16S rRNA (uracil1498-N3)-methyltransferase